MEIDGTGYTVVKSFAGSDGSYPRGELVLCGETLYGLTWMGGGANTGTVFRVGINGSDFRVLKNFAGGMDGNFPAAGLALCGDTLFGATYGDGMNNPRAGGRDAPGYGRRGRLPLRGMGCLPLWCGVSDGSRCRSGR